jgi:hypothetical protein
MRLLKYALCLAALAGLAPLANAQTAVGTAFTYQGRLDDNGQPANGLYDLQFQLEPALAGGIPIGSAVNVDDVSVVNGLFTVKVNFGAAFSGDARFIEIRVRPGTSVGGYLTLTPRQELTPAPYAVGLALPLNESQSSASSLFNLDQNGAGNCVTLTGSNGDCLNVSTDGTGDAIYAHTSGANAAAVGAYTTGAGSNAVFASTTGGGIPIYGYNLGTAGSAGFFRTENSTNPANCVEIQNNGTGVGLHATARTNVAGLFENTNASYAGGVLKAATVGGGPAVWGTTTGTGGAGSFSITNPASSHAALTASTSGTGPAGLFVGDVNVVGGVYATGDVTVDGQLSGKIGGVTNRTMPVAWGRFTTNSNHNPTLLNSSGNVSVSWINSGYRVHVTGETGSLSWVTLGTILYDGVAPEHGYMLRTSLPDGNGNVTFTWNCMNCIIPNFDGDNLQIDFVIYN